MNDIKTNKGLHIKTKIYNQFKKKYILCKTTMIVTKPQNKVYYKTISKYNPIL